MSATRLSNSKIRQLGKAIRNNMLEHDKLNPETLSELESYRASYINSISETFTRLSNISKRIRHDSISTFRIKRIESIISKLGRYPDMQFDRMWDIAGCRCILNSDVKVIKLVGELDSALLIRKTNNYYDKPQASGYRSIHLYTRLDNNDKNTVEIQIRNRDDHNWATLVEIIDLLFDKSIKEGQEDYEFNRFHYLMSKLKIINSKEKVELMKIIHNNQIFKKLLSVFAKNYLEVRLNWLELKRHKHDHFFVIETKKDETPIIRNFSNFNEAEECYFERFKSEGNNNTVMTFLPQTNFTNIETAYSNYTLTTHTFIGDYFRLAENAVIDLIDQRRYRSFYFLFCKYLDNYRFYLNSVSEELKTIERYSQMNKENDRKIKNWTKDLRQRIGKRTASVISAQKRFNKKIPSRGMDRILFIIYSWLANRKARKLKLLQ